MEQTLWLLNELTDDEQRTHISLIGGKGHGLRLIMKKDYRCPLTWVISSEIFNEFKKTWLKSRAIDSTSTWDQEQIIQEAGIFINNQLHNQLLQLPEGLYAVRSSAVVEDSSEHSFAGIFNSRLQVPKSEIYKAVAEVWISGLGRRVTGYVGEVSWPQMAVLIQPMLKARFAGVCFSTNPSPSNITENNNYLVEMVPGIGESLVQGEITPIRLTGAWGALYASTDYLWLPQLLLAANELEKETGSPVDVEFAIDDNDQLWLLQQRPVTKVQKSCNLAMTGYKKAYKRALCSLDIEFLIEGCAGHLACYLEVSVDLRPWMVMLTNQKDFQQELWLNEAIEGAVINAVARKICNDHDYVDRLKTRYMHHHNRILNWTVTAWANRGLPVANRLRDFFEFIVPLSAHYYAPMHIIEALSVLVLEEMRQINVELAEDDFFYLTTTGAITLGQLCNTECLELKKEILAELMELPPLEELPARFLAKVELLAEKYGFLNCHQPYEKPYGTADMYSMLKEASENHEAASQEENNNINAVKTRYSACNRWKELFDHLIYWLNIRNQQMEYLCFVYAKAHPLFTEVGRRLDMTVEEVWGSCRSYLLQSLEKGRASAALPDKKNLTIAHVGEKVLVSDVINPVFPVINVGTARLNGKTAYGSGVVEGTVKVAFTPSELEQILETGLNDIIVVTGMTTPDFVPLLGKKVVGLVTDEGGILCHAAIIAREINLPCIVGTGIASEQLTDGIRIKMDLDRGEVRTL